MATKKNKDKRTDNGGARTGAGRPVSTGIGKQVNFRYSPDRWDLLQRKYGKFEVLAKIRGFLDGLEPEK